MVAHQDAREDNTLSVYWGLPPDTVDGPYPNGLLPGHIEAQLLRDGFANVHLRISQAKD